VSDPRTVPESPRPLTVREVVDAAVATLERAGHARDRARVDVGVLARHVLGWDRATLLMRDGDPMPADAGSRLDALVARRTAREPVAYLTGTREFYGRPFHVSPAVLIPRPETELLVDAVLRHITPDAVPAIADVCTGSGILAITLAAERPLARLDATDISTDALAVARQNATSLGVSDRVRFHHADLFGALTGPYDVIVANPPYVAARDAAGLSPDVGRYEPAVALFGGDDGLAMMPRLLSDSITRLAAHGLLVMEFGLGQEYDVTRCAAETGFGIEEVLHDLQGIARALVCRLPTAP
jgi:release factor glutamine methyltransferase